MRKVILVANVATSIFNFRRNLIKKLIRENMDVLILTNKDNTFDLLLKEGYKIKPLQYLRYNRINPIMDLGFMFELYREYSDYHPDVVLHYHIKPNIYGSIAAKLAKIKSIITITGAGQVFAKPGLTNLISQLLYRIGILCSNQVFFQNRDDRDFFLRNKLVKKNKTVLVAGSGVDTDFFSPDICKNSKRNGKVIKFLLISRMLWEKGVREFVEGARIVKKEFPQAKFQLLGWIGKEPSAIPADNIRKWEEEGIIEFLGSVTDVRPIICQSDVVVLPSYYKEGVPRSLLEAMAMERPIITTDSVGCKDVIENYRNGIQVPVKNVKALAEAMKRMIKTGTSARKAMGRYGRLKAKKEFEESKVIERYLEIIKNLMY